jgi:hypothetical protein
MLKWLGFLLFLHAGYSIIKLRKTSEHLGLDFYIPSDVFPLKK